MNKSLEHNYLAYPFLYDSIVFLRFEIWCIIMRYQAWQNRKGISCWYLSIVQVWIGKTKQQSIINQYSFNIVVVFSEVLIISVLVFVLVIKNRSGSKCTQQTDCNVSAETAK